MIEINGKTNIDYNCDHIHTEVGIPEPKRSSVDVPLRDGSIDTTAFLSAVPFYNDREIVVGLELRAMRATWPSMVSTILNDIHGKAVTLNIGEDPNWYYIGHATVNATEDHGSTMGITITVTAQPYKRRRTTTTVYTGSDADKNITFTVTDARGYLEFTCSAANSTVTYDGQTWTLPSGDSEAYGLVLTGGSQTIAIHQTGSMTIKLRGGSL